MHNSLQKLQNSEEKPQIGNFADLDSASLNELRRAVQTALAATRRAVQDCLIAGAMLNQVKARLPHGQYENWIRKNLPELPIRTAHHWARAAAQVAKAVPPPPAIDIEAALIGRDDRVEAREWRQQWLEFTEGKTIQECLTSVFVEGEEAHRVDRAVNGKLYGGAGRTPRRAFELFVARKLAHITTFLTIRRNRRFAGWRELSPAQQTAIGAAFSSALEKWPEWLVSIIADKARLELKLSPGERIARNSRNGGKHEC